MAKLETIMRMVQGLIAKAEDRACTEAEKEIYTAKAQQLIQEYRLEEEQLIAADGSVKPTRRMVEIAKLSSEFRHEHGWLWSAIARHCGVRYVQKWNSAEKVWEADTIGYDVDIRLAEILFVSSRLVFGAHLEPEVDASLSDMENVYRMRSAGMERNRIAQKLWGADLGKAGHSAHARVGRLYAEACQARGEDPVVSGRQVSAKTYREVYAREFVTAVERRLRLARDAADAAAGALVSVGRAERVDEAFYTAYPSYRPVPPSEEDMKAEAKVTRRKGRERGITKADRARIERLYYGPTATAARRSAHRAAEDVELERPTAARRTDGARRAGELEG